MQIDSPVRSGSTCDKACNANGLDQVKEAIQDDKKMKTKGKVSCDSDHKYNRVQQCTEVRMAMALL